MRGLVVASVLVLASCAQDATSTVTQPAINDDPGNCFPDPDTGQCVCSDSPLIFDLDGDGIHLSGYLDGVVFALRADRTWLWSWPVYGSDDAWLTLPGSNGVVDGGSEMFGNNTLQPVGGDPNGFRALSTYDTVAFGGNSDGKITAVDAVFPQLRLWRDVNRDGVSQSAELISMDRAGVRELSLTYQRTSIVDAHGNHFRYASTIVADAPISPTVYDVWLVGAPPAPAGTVGDEDPTTNSTTLWYAVATCLAVTPASDAARQYVGCDTTEPGNHGIYTIGSEPGLTFDVPGSGNAYTVKREYQAATEQLAVDGSRSLCWASAGGRDGFSNRCTAITKADGVKWSRVTSWSATIPTGGDGTGGGCTP